MDVNMNLESYIADATIIAEIKEKYLASAISMKDMLNGEYKYLTIEDKVNLICWSADYDLYEVLNDGCVIEKREKG